MEQSKIRNIAIIAHVDHGKTTLVDELFKFGGMFRDNQKVAERLMDSNELERERGITITAKNGSFHYKDYRINIIDTPGHADFGGQVERVLKMADGALLLVDAQEGPMPQTFFVLKKALALALPIIVVINKIDKPAARPHWAVDQVFDLFVRLNAPDHILDFPVVYASGRDGYAIDNLDDEHKDLSPLCEHIIKRIPAPSGSGDDPLQVLVNSIDYSPYLGRLGIGKITGGHLNINKDIVVVMRDGSIKPARITKVFRFEINQKVAVDTACCGDIVAISGMDEVTVGCTYTDPLNVRPLPPMEIDPPTISMSFIPNDSPFAGREGQFVTSRHLADRLAKEIMADVALQVTPLGESMGFQVAGRGELHLSILIEKMRREGYEFQVTRPQVIFQEKNGKKLEPFEELTIDVDENYVGVVMEKLGQRKARIQTMDTGNGMARLIYFVPTRGLLGYRSEFLTDTRGMGVMNYVFHSYDNYVGEIRYRTRGAMVCMQTCKTVAYALFNLQDRGRLFLDPGVDVYEGQIVGEHCREGDLIVNPAKSKKLTNMRASGSDEAVILTPVQNMSLEDCIAYINEDELVEVTPANIRLRKRHLRKWGNG
ncbi:translational GTPase TypA [Oligosphaera ethanolica]|uniref:Large ribosomal subunit assembly factor BipA n=1 Tax=Oligosphaera ethanolica TaxID=760260 RepID=A0AAE3VJ85_9BACT|nr:translational GTPase TypA [Oligosphaera ethanolica]MDQ0291587.1 GTP-binding protein [Oligosphaera ethanolica]